MSKTKTLKELKIKIRDSVKQLKSFNTNNLRIWKIPTGTSLETYLKGTFKDKFHNLKKNEKSISKNKLEYLECKL